MLQQFMDNLECGWDFAIEKLTVSCGDERIQKAIYDYWSGYRTSDFEETNDPDFGLCYVIREQAIRQIINILNYKEIMED